MSFNCVDDRTLGLRACWDGIDLEDYSSEGRLRVRSDLCWQTRTQYGSSIIVSGAGAEGPDRSVSAAAAALLCLRRRRRPSDGGLRAL